MVKLTLEAKGSDYLISVLCNCGVECIREVLANVFCLLCFLLIALVQVDIYESRTFIGGKVGSFVDKRGNHIEMGLHVFFGCYNNLFRLMKKVNDSCS